VLRIFEVSTFRLAETNTEQIVPSLYFVTGEDLLNPNCNGFRNLLAYLVTTLKTGAVGSACYPRILPSSQSSPELRFVSDTHLSLNNGYSKDIRNDSNAASKLYRFLYV